MVLKNDYINKIIKAFQEEYLNYFKSEYILISDGKERGAAGKLLKIYKQKFPNSTSEETILGLKGYFHLCVRIKDEWIQRHISLPLIVSKFNQINNIIRNGDKWRQNTKGTSNEELARLFEKHFTEGNK